MCFISCHHPQVFMLQSAARMSEILLVYDHGCLMCEAYCRRAHIRESDGQLQLVDARGQTPLMDELSARGLDLDQGMVLKVGEQVYYGSDAIHELSLLSSRSDPFNQLTYWTFRSARVSHMLYPILRGLHNFILKILGRTKINNLKLPHNERY